jgi:hypothetical protein
LARHDIETLRSRGPSPERRSAAGSHGRVSLAVRVARSAGPTGNPEKEQAMPTIDERIMELHRKAAYFRSLGTVDTLKLAEDIEKALVDVEKAKFDVELTVLRLQMELEIEKKKLELELEVKLREVEIMAIAAPETPDTDEPPEEPAPVSSAGRAAAR